MVEFLPTLSQKGCLEKHSQALELTHFTNNFSEMGLGKTLVAEQIALDRNLKILLVCDPIIKNGWKEKAKTFFNDQVKFVELQREKEPVSYSVSYSLLTGKKGMVDVCYSLLIRSDAPKTSKKGTEKAARPSFTPTEKLKKLIEEGILLVIDESQNVKNITSDRFWATKAIVAEIKKNFESGGRSRAIFLSATPFDKREQIYSSLLLLGVSKNFKTLKKGIEYSSTEYGRRFWETENREYGLFSTYEYTLDFFSRNFSTEDKDDLTKRIQSLSTSYKYWHPDEARELCIEMYLTFVHPYVSCMMFRSKDFEDGKKISYDRKNGFYCVNEETEIEIRNALDTLKLAMLMKENKEDDYYTKFNGMVTTGMRLKEWAKRDLFARIADEELKRKGAKVIIGVDFKDTLFYLRDKLRAYSPLLIYGNTPEDERIANIEAFNKPTDEKRLLLVIISTTKSGIDLHDTNGKFPRVMLLSPNYNFQNLTQISGRIFRKGVMSNPKLRLVFSQQNPEEVKILENLSKKVDVQKTVVGSREGNLLPGEYDNEYQEECAVPVDFPSPLVEKERKSDHLSFPPVLDE